MKTKKTVLFGIVASIAIALLLQSWTNSPKKHLWNDTIRTCTSPTGSFKITLGSNVFFIPGTQVANVVTVSTTDSPPTLSHVTTLSNNWQYCSNDSLVSLDSDADASNAPSIHAKFTNSDNSSILITAKANMDTSARGTNTPQITTFHDSTDSDTLFVIMSFAGTIRSSNYQFTVNSSKNNIVLYTLKDDPKTSRGTVTTVQSSGGSHGWGKTNKITDL